MSRKKIEIHAFGREAQIGSLYSAHEDKFLPKEINLFAIDESNGDQIYDMELSSIDIRYHNTSSFSEKLKLLGVDGETSLSILSGLIKGPAGDSFLSKEERNENTFEMDLKCSLTTVNQEVTMRDMKIDDSVLNNEDASHVVIGIDWGAKCNIQCKYENVEKKSYKQVDELMEEFGKQMKLETDDFDDIKKLVNSRSGDEYKNLSFNAKCSLSTVDKDSMNFQELLLLLQDLPTAVKDLNSGKGSPILYYLLPLSIVSKQCFVPIKKPIVLNSVKDSIVQSFVTLCQETSKSKQQFSYLYSELLKNDEFISDSHLARVKRQRDIVVSFEESYKKEFRDSLIKVRSGEMEDSCLENIIQKSMDRNNGLPNKGALYEKEWQLFQDRCDMKEKVLFEGTSYYGRTKKLHICQVKTIALYLPNDTNVKEKLDENLKLFQSLVKSDATKKSKTKFMVVDTQFHEVQHSTPIIKMYQLGREVKPDYLESAIRQNFKISCVHSDKIKNNDRKPINNRAVLKISCPHCSSDTHVWYHDRCKGQVIYGTKSKLLYCQCGSFEPSDTQFCCNDIDHGVKFYKASTSSLSAIESLKEQEVTNILVLGETGVGKSTWINSIAKYLSYDTFEKAVESKDESVLIPAKFSYTTAEGKIIEIKVGEKDDNERQKTGKSVTKEPTSYLLDIDEKTVIRLIDTPGIGDTDGIEQDEKNFEKILEHLSEYDKIHGICILLKPNNARLGVMLRFCIGELLSHLHISAASNIMFCFTNCRATFYRPGETLPVLIELLKNYKKSNVKVSPKNQFCFDNESFRFLACLQNNIKFNDKKDIETFSGSWDKAVAETGKLFDYVRKLPPHDAKSTISLNKTRKWIVELSKPIAEIQETIKNKILCIENKKRELGDALRTGADLNTRLFIDMPDLEIEKLDFPKTVCHNDKCVETVSIQGINTRKAIQPCHDHCYITGIPTEVLGDPKIQSCAAMLKPDGQLCRECNHSWLEHMHCINNFIKTSKRVIDSDVQKLVQEKKGQAEIHETAIKNLDRTKKVHEEELEFIIETTAKFACFLALNSITPFNDAVEDHLAYLIKEKTQLSAHKEKEDLINMLKKYKTYKEIIVKAISGVDKSKHNYITSPHEADDLKRKLFNLPENGKLIKRILTDVQKNRSSYNHRQYEFQPRSKSRLIMNEGAYGGGEYYESENRRPGLFNIVKGQAAKAMYKIAQLI